MGGLLNCFKSAPTEEKPQLTPEDKAIFECKICKDKLKSYIKRLETNAAKQRELAKEHLKKKNRDRAKMCLNQSKFYTTQIETSNNQLNMLEDQIMRIEQTRSQKETMTVLDQGNKVLKELQKEVNIERWEKISEDMDEMKDNQQEIGDFLKSHNVNMEEYDDSLNKDLEVLMKQEGVIVDDASFPEANKEPLKDEAIEEKMKETEKKEEKVEMLAA